MTMDDVKHLQVRIIANFPDDSQLEVFRILFIRWGLSPKGMLEEPASPASANVERNPSARID
jgi:hypothetical protein